MVFKKRTVTVSVFFKVKEYLSIKRCQVWVTAMAMRVISLMKDLERKQSKLH